MDDLIMIKLGGSLITEKDNPLTPRLDVIQSLAGQLKEIRSREPNLKIILGHGSGSFGHSIAAKYQTRSGVKTDQDWYGFAQVWYAARDLNIFISQALRDQDISFITIPPSAFIYSIDGKGADHFKYPLKSLLSTQIMPVVHGDVIFDKHLGGTILSTEDIFLYLAKFYQPKKILLAGIEEAIWADFPTRHKPIKSITPKNFNKVKQEIGGSKSVDVTGGMIEKVRLMVELVAKYPSIKVNIFSGLKPYSLIEEIFGDSAGTIIEME